MSTEQVFIQRLSQSEDAAWDEFVHLYEPRILGFAFNWGLQDADAHDVTQNVLIAVAKALPHFELDESRGTFWNWIATITHREILRRMGQLQRLARTKSDMEDAGIKPGLDRSPESLSRLYSVALLHTEKRCSPTDWRVFRRMWVQGDDPRKIADREGHTTAWVYRAKFRAIEVLRQEVAQLSDDSAFTENLV